MRASAPESTSLASFAVVTEPPQAPRSGAAVKMAQAAQPRCTQTGYPFHLARASRLLSVTDVMPNHQGAYILAVAIGACTMLLVAGCSHSAADEHGPGPAIDP